MKILHIAYHFDEYLYELVSALEEHSIDTKLILVSNKKTPVAFAALNITKFRKPRIRQALRNINLLLKIKNEIANYSPIVVHFQGCSPWFSFLLIKLFKQYQIVNTVHDVTTHLGEEKRWLRWTKQFMRNHSHKFIVHGKILKTQLLQTIPKLDSTNVFVIPHGPLSTYGKLNSCKYSEKQNHLLFFGRIFDYKGLEYLIWAEPLVSKHIQDFKIVIAGIGKDFSSYRKLMTDENKYIVINRYISEEEVSKLFQESSIVVLPYNEASQSGIIPIAYEFKKPVIVTDVGALSEVVDNSKTGIIVKPQDEKQLADAIVKLLKDKKSCRQMGENGYKKLITELNWNQIAKKTIAAYQAELY